MHVRYHIGKRQHQRDVSKKRGPTDSSSLGGHKYPAEGRQVRTVHNIQSLPSAPMLTGGDRFERDIVVVQARAAAQSQFLADIEQGSGLQQQRLAALKGYCLQKTLDRKSVV